MREVLDSSDEPEELLLGLRRIAEAQGMAKVAEAAGLSRDYRYATLALQFVSLAIGTIFSDCNTGCGVIGELRSDQLFIGRTGRL